MVDLSKKIQETWGILEKNSEPSEFKDVINLEFSFLHSLIVYKNINEINKLLKLFHAGSLIIIKNSFNIEDLNFIKKYLIKNYNCKKSEFHKLKENCPNFHRVIGPEESKNYVIPSNRHDYYFFPWNRQKEEK